MRKLLVAFCVILGLSFTLAPTAQAATSYYISNASSFGVWASYNTSSGAQASQWVAAGASSTVGVYAFQPPKGYVVRYQSLASGATYYTACGSGSNWVYIGNSVRIVSRNASSCL